MEHAKNLKEVEYDKNFCFYDKVKEKECCEIEMISTNRNYVCFNKMSYPKRTVYNLGKLNDVYVKLILKYKPSKKIKNITKMLSPDSIKNTPEGILLKKNQETKYTILCKNIIDFYAYIFITQKIYIEIIKE